MEKQTIDFLAIIKESVLEWKDVVDINIIPIRLLCNDTYKVEAEGVKPEALMFKVVKY
jgi:hypothetical protein